MIDFTIIGSMKCGTSTLHHNLKDVEGINLTKNKEVNFFSEYPIDKKIYQYRKEFSGFGKKGDISPRYSKRHIWPSTSWHLKQLAPNAKIIYLVRDPIRRIISHLHHDLLRDRFKPTELAKVLTPESDYILTSSYFYQLEPYYNLFEDNQIMVLSFEDLISNKNETLKRLLLFIGVEEIPYFKLHPYNVSDTRYKIKYHDLIHKHIKSHVLLKLYHHFWHSMNIKVAKPILSTDSLYKLKYFIKKDVSKFAKINPLIVESWKTYNSIPN